MLLIIVLLIGLTNGQNSALNSVKPEFSSVDQKWIKTFDQFFASIRLFAHSYRSTVEKSLKEVNVSSECSRTVSRLLTNPEEEWVISMLESSGRLPIGLLSGTITSYGDYDQCLSTSGLVDHDIPVYGKYCFLNIRPPLPGIGQTLDLKGSSYEKTWVEERIGQFARMYGRVSNGLCIPSTCSQQDMTDLLRNVFCELEFSLTVEHCSQRNDRTVLDWVQIISILSLTLCIVSVIIGTIYDEFGCKTCPEDNSRPQSKTRNTLKEVFLCFSFTSNARKVFTISDSGESELKYLHGLRVLSILWVILCHTTNFAPLALYDQPMIAARFKIDGVNVIKHLWTQLIISGSLSVQTFFIISGLISLHTVLKYKKSSNNNVKLKFWQFVLIRWLRFAPPLFGMFCYQFIWPLLGSGPMFHHDFLKYGLEPCYHNWWPSFLFINNWWPLADQCASHTWYLGADFQITLIAYFVIIYYIKDYKKAIYANIAMIVIGIVLPTFINFVYQLPLVHILDPDPEKLSINYSMTEFNTYNHLMAYFTGTLLAAVINSETQIKIPCAIKRWKNVIWTVVLVLMLITPFSTYPFIQLDEIPASNLTIIYNTVKRLIWISGIAWIIFASATFHRDSYVSKFLSAKIWQPFSRLTFSIYLVQSLVVWYHGYQTRHLYPIDHYNALFRVGGTALFSVILGFGLHILLEAPSVNLCKLAFASKGDQKLKSNDVNNNEEMKRLNESKPHEQ